MKGGIMYDQNDVVLIPFPYSDLTGTKQRPALIISNHLINETQDRICCLITSNPSAKGINIEKSDFKSGKLPFKSLVKPQRIFTINEKVIRKKLCTMNDNFHNKILIELNKFLRKE